MKMKNSKIEPKPKALFFDFDDTLQPFDPCSRQALESSCQAFSLPFNEQVYQHYRQLNHGLWRRQKAGELSVEDVMERRFQLFLKDYGQAQLAEVFNQRYISELNRCVSKEPGADEVLDRLSRQYELFICSNGRLAEKRSRIELAGWTAYFKDLFVSDDIGFDKPDPRYFELCLQRSRYSADEVLFIGDSWTADILGARRVGLPAIWYCVHSRSDQEALPAEDSELENILCLKQLTELLPLLDEEACLAGEEATKQLCAEGGRQGISVRLPGNSPLKKTDAVVPESRYPRPEWLERAVFYEIYPQSFYDANGDGIGDIPGIISKLDYIADLGANAIWLSPCFDSPFKDAGYDVRDYKRVAARYGTNDDLIALFNEAHRRGMKVLLDLVPGHTSEEHPWFIESSKSEANAFTKRYIWTNSAFEGAEGRPFISGESERDGAYILNFFKCQPALNYGWAEVRKPWQSEALGKEACETCAAMVDVMRFWLERGADGFRVDMADSLVKGDGDEKTATIKTWQFIFDQLRPDFPQAAFVSEWGRPGLSSQAGFDMDFWLDWGWGEGNGYHHMLRFTRDTKSTDSREGDRSYFNAGSSTSALSWLVEYRREYEASRSKASFCFITCNHDTPRLAPRLSRDEIALAYCCLLTLPGNPFIYYGDEIGQRYLPLPSKEGGYHRTGSRTPMQWKQGRNFGFSNAAPEQLYLPVDPDVHAPTVEENIRDPRSLFCILKQLIALRRQYPSLLATSDWSPIACNEEGKALLYKRYCHVSTISGHRGEARAVNPDLKDWQDQGQEKEEANSQVARPLKESLFVCLNPGLKPERLNLPAQEFMELRSAKLIFSFSANGSENYLNGENYLNYTRFERKERRDEDLAKESTVDGNLLIEPQSISLFHLLQ